MARAGLARSLALQESLKKSFKWDEERFGREYDLDQFNVVAVSDFNMGAMENKSLNVFNDRYVLANPKTATVWGRGAGEAWAGMGMGRGRGSGRAWGQEQGPGQGATAGLWVWVWVSTVSAWVPPPPPPLTRVPPP